MKPAKSHLFITLGVLTWCIGLLLPPLVARWEYPSQAFSHQFYSFFSLICHQFDERSLHLFGYKFGVCARCTGIYGGFFIGTLVFSIGRRPAGKTILWWTLGLLPMLVDVVLDVSGLHSSSIALRCITGGIFGIVAALILVPILSLTFSQNDRSSIIHEGASHESKT
jgi:uncharacterized membrane protein